MINNNSVIVKLKGRLGNVLFQIAAALTYATKYNKNLYLFIGDGGGWVEYYKLYYDFIKKFHIISFQELNNIGGIFFHENEPSHEYTEFPNVYEENIILDGYWQDVRYIDFNLVLPNFMCSENIIENIKNRLNIENYHDYVFLSIRHGLDYQNYNVALSMEWFEEVYNEYFSDKKAIIATDDVLFVEKKLKYKEQNYYSNV